MQNEFAGKCEEEAKAVSRCVEDVFPDQMALFNVIIENFQEAFEKEFKKLGILKVNFNSKSTEVSVSDRGALTNLNDATAYVSKELSKENWAAAGTIARRNNRCCDRFGNTCCWNRYRRSDRLYRRKFHDAR